MLTKRIIPCLDVKLGKEGGKVVKGVEFEDLKEAGNPVELSKRYNKDLADELVFLDITASSDNRKTMLDVVKKTSEEVFIPLTVGGGISSTEEIKKTLRAGADKVSINTAAVKDPNLLSKGARLFGSQCIVSAIDAKRRYEEKENKNLVEFEDGRKGWFEVYTYGGREPTGKDAIKWASEVEKKGAGEILLTSMDKDGKKSGYDIGLTKNVSENVNIPVIASGGGGNPQHFVEAFKKGKADACLAASIFHYKEYSIKNLKKELKENDINVRI
ncbi:imidazole glycerol phosphate synthase subunit HisF [archaeon SCG-AAA382B04]|nr:imidazole glycerol phosphate synthase subunit HisF [archaeon SCG-AAA382B04]